MPTVADKAAAMAFAKKMTQAQMGEPPSDSPICAFMCDASEVGEVFGDLLAACESLDKIDWVIGYEMTPQNCEVIDVALQLARAAVAKAKKSS
jgi:hypothetical protein